MKQLIKNAHIIQPEQIIEGNLVIKDQFITEINNNVNIDETSFDLIHDAEGSYILPGIIDIHADDIEKELQPRPTSVFPINYAFRESEKKLIGKGITTMFHSLAIYDGNYFGGKSIRTKEYVENISDWINRNRHNGLIHHRFHLRYEVDNLLGVDYVKDLLKNDQVDLISFMDHTPGQGQYRNIEKFKEALKDYDKIGPEIADKLIQDRINAPKISKETLEEIAKIAKMHNVGVASHDDDTIEKINWNLSWGATISEFPITIEVAKYAKQNGLAVMVGSPNIILGGSHSGNLSAAEAIIADCVDILCSDYKPSSILGSIFYMNHKHQIPLEKMVAMATINPAKAVNIDDQYGALEVGKKFDAIQVTLIDEIPVVERVWVDGTYAFHLDYRKMKV